MRKNIISGALLLATAVIAVLALYGQTIAGQFKRLNASTLAVGAQITAHASPVNQGNAMEMDTYEFLVAPAGGNYRCRIVSNSTGQTLNLRLIGVDGTIASSCAAPNGGTCNTGTFALVGNLLFQCLVSTHNGAPVVGGAHYIFA